jgi:hypothetical protein
VANHLLHDRLTETTLHTFFICQLPSRSWSLRCQLSLSGRHLLSRADHQNHQDGPVCTGESMPLVMPNAISSSLRTAVQLSPP